ncbi:uncharacterized protein LOC142572896 isoform X1 [Dermacentor variabilis]|uniref:uncharacterized protein LOC142572896 isoform X1 n=1 Tax=Dermacentor variabilis TaxID=34621 RepID=UPI003F5B91FE
MAANINDCPLSCSSQRKESTPVRRTAIAYTKISDHESCSVAYVPGPYNSSLVPAGEFKVSPPAEENNVDVAAKAGKKLEALGRVMQGKLSESSAEAQREVAEALEALAAGEAALDKESSEYWVGVVVRGVIGGAVAHGIDRWKRRKG